jgi:hypothetical protein
MKVHIKDFLKSKLSQLNFFKSTSILRPDEQEAN